MDRIIDDGTREPRLDETATLALDSLDIIERATSGGCSARALQDIVGNLLVLLASLDEGKEATQRSLVVDCLAKAGVPPHAIPDALGLIRDCFGQGGSFVDIEIDAAFSADAAG